jgi:hypothetical protein
MGEICVLRLQARLICHGWVTPAARDARRSFAVKSDIRGARTHVQPRAAGVSPPWILGECTCRNAAAKSRETAIGALTNPGASAFAKPRGAYAPRSWLCCTLDACRKIATYAMHKRTFNQERRVSARRGFVLRTLGCEERRLCSDWRTSDQERRVSAHRGFVLRTLGREDRRLCSDWRTSDQERWASARRGLGIALAETFDSRLANDATNDTGISLPRGSKGVCYRRSVRNCAGSVCLFSVRAVSVTDVRFAVACLQEAAENHRCWLRRNVE